MKEYLIGAMLAFCLVLIPFAEAGISIPEFSISFGGSGFEKTKSTIEKEFTLKRDNANFTITNLEKVLTAKNGFSASNIDITLPSILDKDQLKIKIKVTPADFDAVDSELKERGQVEIAEFSVKGKENGGDVETNNVSFRLEIENNLEVAKIELTHEDDSKKSISKEKTYTITEDEDITLTFKIENTFGSSGLKLENIKVTVTSKNLDIDEDTKISEIEASKDDDVEVKFSVSEVDKADVIVELGGEDELGGKHGETFKFEFDVEEKKNDDPPDDPDPPDKDDADGDGVPDADDLCPNTVSKCSADDDGCPIDTDEDGVCDALDPTPNGDKKATDQKKNVQTNQNMPPPNQDQQKQQKSNDEETDGIIPFLIGFFIGIFLTAGFFMLIKS